MAFPGEAAKVSPRGWISTHVVHGDHTEEVVGNQNRSIGGTRTETVEGDALQTVRGMLGETIEGPAVRHIGTSDEPQSGEVFAYGSYLVAAGETVRIRAETSVVLECGESSIELTPDGIRLRGRDIRTIATELASMQSKGSTGPSLIATDQIEIAASEIHLFGEDSRLSLTKEAELTSGKKTVVMGGGAGLGLAGGATLAGGKVIVAGKGATLVLDAEAKLDGAMVKLNCGGEGGGVSAEDRDPKKLDTPRDVVMKHVNVRVYDESLVPMRERPYALTVLGRVISGVTSATGDVDAEVPEEAQVGQLTVWEEYPEGERLQWKVNFEPPLPPPHRPPGARIRLANLGYYQGPPVEEMDDRLRQAVQRFQQDVELPPTGELEPLTVYRLLVVHRG